MSNTNTLSVRKMLLASFLACMLTACSSIQPVGDLGPQKLKVYSIEENDFLSSSHMLVVLNKKGDIAAYTGGTVSGGGTVALQTGSTLAMAGAVVYGAKSIQNGLQNVKANTTVNVKGVPSTVNIHATGELIKH